MNRINELFSGRNHVDESISVLVYFSYPCFTGFGSNEHDDAQVVLLCYRAEFFYIIFKWQVGNDYTVYAAALATFTEIFEAILHDGVQVAHENKWNTYFLTNFFQLVEEFS